jgi:alpha-glucosidase
VSKQSIWQQGAVIYQIYPRSFYDATGDGVGDLAGLIDKLDYLGGSPESLGVTAIWLSPIYTSPMADFGYDVANYTDVDPLFGNLKDFKLLVREAHKRSIKIVLDFVPNHSSDEHPWFIESSSSLDNPKRDWYVWRDAKADGKVPNNWISCFGGSAWQFSLKTQQYYLHSYLSKQPDLNWDNPALREAMKSVMRFWLDLDVDGFRVDAVDWMSKDPKFQDDPPLHPSSNTLPKEYNELRHTYSRNGPYLFDRLNEMTEVLAEYKDRFMITEVHPETDNKMHGYLEYYEGVNPHLSAPFNLQSIHLPWDAAKYRNFVNDFQSAMKPGYTPIYTTGNHDESRIATRIGNDAARTAAMMLLTLPGIAFMYYGEELGMTDVILSPEEIRDPFIKPGEGRDPQRTPMQWSNSSHAGFTKGKPWLPVSSNYPRVNVETEAGLANSLLNLYKKLLAFRNHSAILKTGTYKSIPIHRNIFGYERCLGSHKILVLLNFSAVAHELKIESLEGTLQLSTYLDIEDEAINKIVKLRPNEGVIIEVSND